MLPFFGLNGPQFLVAYGLIALAALIGLWAYLRSDNYAGLAPPIPARPDPYEIAYLRGGLPEVAAVAIYALTRKGAIAVDATSGAVTRAAGSAGADNAVEAAVLRVAEDAMPVRALANSAALLRMSAALSRTDTDEGVSPPSAAPGVRPNASISLRKMKAPRG